MTPGIQSYTNDTHFNSVGATAHHTAAIVPPQDTAGYPLLVGGGDGHDMASPSTAVGNGRLQESEGPAGQPLQNQQIITVVCPLAPRATKSSAAHEMLVSIDPLAPVTFLGGGDDRSKPTAIPVNATPKGTDRVRFDFKTTAAEVEGNEDEDPIFAAAAECAVNSSADWNSNCNEQVSQQRSSRRTQRGAVAGGQSKSPKDSAIQRASSFGESLFDTQTTSFHDAFGE